MYNVKVYTVKPVLSDRFKYTKQSDILMKVESITDCIQWSILQYFWPALGDNRYWNSILLFVLSDPLGQVLLYVATIKLFMNFH